MFFEILKKEGYPFKSEFRIIREQEKNRFLEGIVSSKEMKDFLEEIRCSKQRLSFPATGKAGEYQKRLIAGNFLDFDDIFIYGMRLFKEKPEILDKYRSRFRHILVDEFQDTSFAQYMFMKEIARENICVIGDPDQSIYGFINGFFNPFEQFKKDFPGAEIISIRENYRSQNNIIEAAKQIIEKNLSLFPRELKACVETGLPIEIISCKSEKHEAELVVRKIENLLGGSSHFAMESKAVEKEIESRNYSLSDIAILYRFHAQAKILEGVLEKAGLPYETFGRKNEEVSAEEEFKDFVAGGHSVPPPPEHRAEKIILLTLHRSKGLEFPVVFITGLGFLKDIHETLKIFKNAKIPSRKKKPVQDTFF
ncbi:MAG: UvrD-helicase domain-containing protein [Elusimicrobia bacterium]|nr:UvrD-helicase domain-containing protein [Elusimicrobiota bacterium]